MKIYFPPRRTEYNNTLVKLFQDAGLEVTQNPSESYDFVYFGLNFEGIYDNVPESYKAHSGLQLTDKSVLHDTLIAAGLNSLEYSIIQDLSTIENFNSTNVFVKPLNSTGSMTPYTFVYKIFTSKTELINTINQEAPDFFTVNEDGSSICSKHIIQQAIMPAEDGYVHQYYVPVYINGQGTIVSDGLAKLNMRFNELNDIDDVVYPLRHMRDYVIRNTADQTDQYGILEHLATLISHCQIRNTPMHTQWLIDETGKPYLIDVAYQFQRATMGLRSGEFMSDKVQYVYDMKPAIEYPPSGWVGMIDFVITSEKASTLEYATSVGLTPAPNWQMTSKAQCLTIPFTFYGETEQECLDKIALLRTYIANNTTE